MLLITTHYLQSSDAFVGSCQLEVHVSEVILDSLDREKMTVNLHSASPVRQSKARLERDRTHQNISEQSVVLDVCRFLWVGF